MADELDAFLARRPTSFDRSPRVRFGLWVRRNPHLTLASTVAVALALMTAATFATVTRLRARSQALRAEMTEVEQDKATLAQHNRDAREELTRIEATLGERSAALATLRATVEATRLEATALVDAKDRLLRTATTTTRRLADQVDEARSDRASTELARALYERFWISTRDEEQLATVARDAARGERELARAERDQAVSTLASERTRREEAERDRDAARARVDELRRDFDARLATVSTCSAPSAPHD